MDTHLSDAQTPPFPQPQEPPQPQRPQVQAPTLYVYEQPSWEYKVVVRRAGAEELLSEQELNELGSKGWELAGVNTLAEAVQFYFKRVRK